MFHVLIEQIIDRWENVARDAPILCSGFSSAGALNIKYSNANLESEFDDYYWFNTFIYVVTSEHLSNFHIALKSVQCRIIHKHI